MLSIMFPIDVFAQETAALVRPEFGVEALFLEQLGVTAFFDDAAFVQDDEPVHRGDGGEAVGDGDDGFAVHHFVEAFLDGGFDFGVERAGGFVEQQNRRVFEHDAGDGDALALAAGEFHAAFANVGIITAPPFGIGKVGDEIGGFGAFGGGNHFGVGGVGAAVNDVVAHGTVQQRGVLRDQTDLGAQAFLGYAVDVLPVNRNRAALRFVEAQKQVDDGGFARAAASDQADFFARADGEVEAVEQRFACFVGEIDVFELDFALRHFQRQGVRLVEDGVRLGQGYHAVADGADVFKQSGGFPHDVLRQTVDAQRHGGGGGNCADADLSVIPKPDAQRGRAGG